MREKLSNGFLIVEVDSFGAELKSVINRKTGKEYIWNGDPKYWKRSSPILFPFVGITKDKKYMWKGKEYPVTQHGFARDNEFVLRKKSEKELVYSFSSNANTLKVYPFEFELIISYLLIDNEIIVSWQVKNNSKETMYFSIGAHPAFMCGENKLGYSLCFNSAGPLYYRCLNDITGLITDDVFKLPVHNGKIVLTKTFFDKSALVFENKQSSVIGIEDKQGNRFVEIHFDSPVFGLWSPEGKNAPFICIEPWYGRCDAEDFVGDLSQREYTNLLNCGETFYSKYSVLFN